jgi:hypothetical protein
LPWSLSRRVASHETLLPGTRPCSQVAMLIRAAPRCKCAACDMYPGSPLGHRDKACWFNCSNIQHRPTSGPVRGSYTADDPARGAGRRAVAGGRLTRCPGHRGCAGPRRDDGGTRHDAGRRGATFGAARARRLCAPEGDRDPLRSDPRPLAVRNVAGARGRGQATTRPASKTGVKTWISRLFEISLRKATPARVRSTRARAGTERSQRHKTGDRRAARASYMHMHVSQDSLSLLSTLRWIGAGAGAADSGRGTATGAGSSRAARARAVGA